MCKQLKRVGQFVKEKLLWAQKTQAQHYNKGIWEGFFQPGHQVLLCLPTPDSKLLAKWQGSYKAVRQVGKVDYEIHCPDKKKKHQIFHVHRLKPWQAQESFFTDPTGLPEHLDPQIQEAAGAEDVWIAESLTPKLTLASQKHIDPLRHGILHPFSAKVNTSTETLTLNLPRRKAEHATYCIPEQEVQAILTLASLRSPICSLGVAWWLWFPSPMGSVDFAWTS